MATMKRLSSGVSRLSSWKRRLEAASDGLRYSQPRLAASPSPAYWLPKPRMTPVSALRVFVSNVLKSWSRSTAVVVWLVGSVPPSSISGVSGARRELEVDVAVGDAGERGLADRGAACPRGAAEYSSSSICM